MPQEDKSIPTARPERNDDRSDGRSNDRYDAQRIEQKWTGRWQNDAALYAAEPNSTKPKYYVLEMLPYPRARSTWDTCVTMPLAMPWLATCG